MQIFKASCSGCIHCQYLIRECTLPSSLLRPSKPTSSSTTRLSTTTPPTLRTSSPAAARDPPVARRSSTMTTF